MRMQSCILAFHFKLTFVDILPQEKSTYLFENASIQIDIEMDQLDQLITTTRTRSPKGLRWRLTSSNLLMWSRSRFSTLFMASLVPFCPRPALYSTVKVSNLSKPIHQRVTLRLTALGTVKLTHSGT
jgi:hypothetical protein